MVALMEGKMVLKTVALMVDCSDNWKVVLKVAWMVGQRVASKGRQMVVQMAEHWV